MKPNEPQTETWVLLPWSRTSSNYEVSSEGSVRNYATKRVLKPYRQGYWLAWPTEEPQFYPLRDLVEKVLDKLADEARDPRTKGKVLPRVPSPSEGRTMNFGGSRGERGRSLEDERDWFQKHPND